jgi:hypothetical protein
MNMRAVRLVVVLGLLGVLFPVFAQAPGPLENQISALWRGKKYTEISVLLDAHTSAANPDVAALYCAKVFYLLIQPNRDKALSAATKLKTKADSTGAADFIAFAGGELAEVQNIPTAEFPVSQPAFLNLLHKESPDSFPTIFLVAALKKY